MRPPDDFYHSEMTLDVATVEPASAKAAMRLQIQEAMKKWRGKIEHVQVGDGRSVGRRVKMRWNPMLMAH